MSAEAGWYPDPSAPAQQRYWDGAQWTDHVAAGVAAPAVATTPDGHVLAGWWWRVLATIIDSLLISLAGVLVMLPGYIRVVGAFIDAGEHLESLDAAATPEQIAAANDAFAEAVLVALTDNALWFLPGMILPVVYYVVMLRWKGATLGKSLLGMQVRLRASPGPLSWSTVLARTAVQHLNYLLLALFVLVIAIDTDFWPLYFAVYGVSLFYYLDVLWAAWDGKKQTLHDKVAGTNVVTVR